MAISSKVNSLITKANELTEQVRALGKQIDGILDPVVTEAMARGSKAELEELLRLLPPGYHRSELRVHLNRKFG